jgi:hypothetical protein
MSASRIDQKRLFLVISILMTPGLVSLVFLMWISSGPFRITTLFLFPYAAVEMLIERLLRPPDSLGAPTYLAILIACAQYPIYGWLLGNRSEIAKARRKAAVIAFGHVGICSLVLFLYFTGRL